MIRQPNRMRFWGAWKASIYMYVVNFIMMEYSFSKQLCFLKIFLKKFYYVVIHHTVHH